MTEMEKGVSFTAAPANRGEADGGETILAAAPADIPIRADCGGRGICGKCRVIASPVEPLSPPDEIESSLISPAHLAAGIRLACRTKISGPVKVRVLEPVDAAARGARRKTIQGIFKAVPAVKRIFLPAVPPVAPFGYTESILERAANFFSGKEKVNPPFYGALRQISTLHEPDGELTLVMGADGGIDAVWPGRRTTSLGLAVDLGTTTIAAYLCDFSSGAVVASASVTNPQIRFGEDVIGRIHAAGKNGPGVAALQSLAAEAVNYLIARCIAQAGKEVSDIDELAVAGNTAMLHIFGGIDPSSLGVYPYRPVCRFFPETRSEALGLDIAAGIRVVFLPAVAGFIGADVTAAVLADGMHRRKKISLLIDIGTNGEIVLGNRNGLWAASCATGPAFEGAQISCGMPAAAGAVYRVSYHREKKRFDYAVMGTGPTAPLGICGTGALDLLASLREAGCLTERGLFSPGWPQVVYDEQGLGRKFVLVPAADNSAGLEVAFTLKDVRQLQLAKAALAVGTDFLMETAGIDRVDRLVLTGSFGAAFSWKSAAFIGLFAPPQAIGRVRTKENLTGVGTAMALLNEGLREELRSLAGRIQVLDLAAQEGFSQKFAEKTRFPDLGIAKG
jgi:uncharacterized 2Fe-2S/4Fe-4S cluster protein (DUF4445 family)